jgi:DNA-binding transcriptional LysR family regulator
VDGLLDFAVLVRPAELSGVTTSPIALETFLAIGATRTRGGHPGPRTLADFQAQRWAVFDGDLAMHRTWWRAAFGPKAALPERVSCQVASLEELLALAESGAVLTVLPDYLVGPAVAAGRVTVLAPAPGQYARQRSAGNTIFLAWRTGAVESARVRAVREVLQSP